jgi:hypothetical protein
MSKSPADTLIEISTGFTLPRTLHVTAELGVADALGETPLSADALAALRGCPAQEIGSFLDRAVVIEAGPIGCRHHPRNSMASGAEVRFFRGINLVHSYLYRRLYRPRLGGS